MTRVVAIRARHPTRRVDARLLRRITLALLDDLPGLADCELGVHLVGARAMTRLNGRWLGHPGSTDVITFDHVDRDARAARWEHIHGELFISLDDAIAQAREFQTSWPAELVRYLVHGILHLRGHDDRTVADRRRMKREEERLVRSLSRRFPLHRLGRAA